MDNLKRKSSFNHLSKKCRIHNRHQIYSINLWTMEDMFLSMTLCVIDSSYDHFESVSLFGIEPDILHLLLTHYTCLPRLFSLNIDTKSSCRLKELSDIYQSIFALSKLESIELETDIFDDSESRLPLSIATNKQFSNIKYLYIHHSCSFQELFAIISYTLQLCRLKLSYTSDNDEPIIGNVLPISLLSLIHFSIDRYDMKFDKFRWFIKNIFFAN
ncbi:unnamed protein product [Rotaria sordida]|uniref:Uncharacterized protein n=1 Tax=Rotaria sordida TaxID=392033 RepID=A0A820CBQ7_9BILA|nr:unnamed protein product [Rotaria sordida]CAF4204834.1 unnamed protein product [Rotaria sordida]